MVNPWLAETATVDMGFAADLASPLTAHEERTKPFLPAVLAHVLA
jgi:hypothetical protein